MIADASPALCFKDFTFQYQAQAEPTLVNINLTVRRGEKILILGPSGSGKSTLAHCINGLVPQGFKGSLQGSLSILGRDSRDLSIFEISKMVGTVLQDTDGQFVGLNAGEDIAFAAENDCIPTADMRRRVVKAARLVRMEDHLGKAPQDLSGGQKQRVSIAGVLMDAVEILLFDEPLANLDPAAGKEAIELIDTLHRETGKTVIIVEHRLEDALHRPVDRIVVIAQGRIIADLPPAELLASDVLRKNGIREPLYLSALRYAGIEIRPEMRPESVQTIEFDRKRLGGWAETLPDPAPEEARPALLELRDLDFYYPRDLEKRPVLEGISFTLAKGECVSLVGKNGAGKSTLAKLICGFNRPVSGSIRFEGQDLADCSIKERAERIGYVIQNPNQMISHPMIFDETALGLRTRGIGEREIRERVEEVLRVCGLYPFRNWPVSALSFGQKKRLTIASILVMGVSLLILDEPTAGQDYRHYSEIMEFLQKLNREQGLSFLLVTHDMHLMLEYTRRALVLAEGRLLASGSPADILTDDRLVEAASLKRTSLYDLALRADIANPRAFVRHFINYEDTRREGPPL
ncbi:MAG: ABC transporter ATP-binding protein [Treponema sp.]|jgi:energy-coupling factor transport system ATP-binding protein|nr:ABC transporter ATP-binding protein [Treponema sp.]